MGVIVMCVSGIMSLPGSLNSTPACRCKEVFLKMLGFEMQRCGDRSECQKGCLARMSRDVSCLPAAVCCCPRVGRWPCAPRRLSQNLFSLPPADWNLSRATTKLTRQVLTALVRVLKGDSPVEFMKTKSFISWWEFWASLQNQFNQLHLLSDSFRNFHLGSERTSQLSLNIFLWCWFRNRLLWMDRLGVICEIILEPVGRQYLARKPKNLVRKIFTNPMDWFPRVYRVKAWIGGEV